MMVLAAAVRMCTRLELLVVCAAVLTLASPCKAQSIARQWNEALLSAIRVDFARPTVHARNLWHTSVAMWDAWAAYDETALNYLHDEKMSAVDVAAARAETLSYACYRILEERFLGSPGEIESLAAFDALMAAHGYDINITTTFGATPAALGNRIAETVLEFGYLDNSNELGNYANLFYSPVNAALLPAFPGNPTITDTNRWQPLALDFFVDQAGNPIPTGPPPFQSPEWGQVSAFALSTADRTVYNRGGFDYWVFHDPGAPPQIGTATDAAYKWGFELVAAWSSHLDPADGVMIDISPGAIGNAALPDPNDFQSFYDFSNGGDWGTGHASNPITGLPYTPQLVPRGDYARVLAEFWADGPDSETPPGHWFVIGNYVSDHPQTEKRLGGTGPVLDDLEWDVKLYFALGGAMHDSAVSAWGIKGWYDYLRPISALRYMADQGQSSDPLAASYAPNGIDLHPGLIELVSAATTAAGERHEHLAGSEGKIAVYAWRGPDFIVDPDIDVAGVGWILVEEWWPYQRPTFVTPPFAGYVSGHSTYSRAGAVVLTNMTGSVFFPGGLGEFLCPQNQFLVFEDGPSIDITLQWATYNDASDQTSLSRIWGGIHPPADDIPGRYIGQQVGEDAFFRALTYFGGMPVPAVPGFGWVALVLGLIVAAARIER
ncbi:MAG: vanadium-dependent haloperoxidase [Myxococcota bacterium]|nr:vanadium-dependent haloperoxidase [Myxococcota bacterium]